MKLRDYQQKIFDEALPKLKEKNIIMLAMETRTGKTITSLAIATAVANKILFITKKKAIANIKKDAELFDADITVINFESIHKVEDEFELVIVDEVHRIGSFPKPALAQKIIREKFSHLPFILLSATPTPESWSSLYHEFQISSYSPFTETKFYKWAKNYVKVTQKRVSGGRFAQDYSNAKIDKIKAILDDYIITLTQETAGFKTVIKERILSVEMSSYTHTLVDNIKKDNFLMNNKEEVSVLCDTEVKTLSKLHQLSSGSVITLQKNYIIIDKTKAYAIKEDMQKHNYKKAVIFTKFKSEELILKNVFPVVYTDNIKFQEAKEGIFVSQVISGREGIRLDTANVLYFYNMDFAFLSYEQAKNRLQDLTRTTVPEIVFVFSDTGLENEIYKTVKKKKKFTVNIYKRIEDNIQ